MTPTRPDTRPSAGTSERTATQAVVEAYERIAADGRPGIWISLVDREAALAAAEDVERRRAAGADLPLAGTTLAVKDNIDVEGTDTTAGCPDFAYRPDRSAAAVRALEAAGAVVVGKTNLDQFATGLVGTRSPYGICPNAHWPGLLSGGSSSGSAVAVAAGLVDLALGTDTAGSGRVPAAMNGIVGLKPTRGRLSTAGVVPACASLDCVSVFAPDVATAALAARVATPREPDPEDPWSRRLPAGGLQRPTPTRVAVPDRASLDFDGDAGEPARWASVVEALVAAGSELVELDLTPFVEAGRLLYDGAFVAERHAAVGSFVEAHPDRVDPVVGPIIAGGGRWSASDLFADVARLAALRARAERSWHDSGAQVLAVPTVPRLPTVAEALAEPVALNTMLGRYTNFVNLFDLCALTVPIAPADPAAALPPPNLTLLGRTWDDQVLVHLATALTR